jgi:hypothetical protein
MITIHVVLEDAPQENEEDYGTASSSDQRVKKYMVHTTWDAD